MKWVPVRARDDLNSAFCTVFCTDHESDLTFGQKCVFCLVKRVQKFTKNRQIFNKILLKITKYAIKYLLVQA